MSISNKNTERDAKILALAKEGKKRKEIADIFGLTESAVSKVCVKNGARSKVIIREPLKREIAKYRSRHGLKKTVNDYGISANSVIKYHRKYADDMEEKTHSVRVLKEVPSGFVAPKRVW